MACFHPLPAYADREGGPPRIGRRPGEEGDFLELPCGRCIGCRQDRSRDWSLRIMHEAQSWDSNLFVTLDYAPEFLPSSLSLEYEDFQKFMKRLRRACVGVSADESGKRPVRFFCAGEYGKQYRRPHWHAILFNLRFDDMVRLYNGSYRSEKAEKLWSNGMVHIGDLTRESAAYVAGYTVEKSYGRPEVYEDVVNPLTGEVSSRRPEFCTMSRRPGIGSRWFEKFSGDLFPHDFAVYDGKRHKIPRYYRTKYEDAEGTDPRIIEEVRQLRCERARAVDAAESSEARRETREELAWLRLKYFSERSH